MYRLVNDRNLPDPARKNVTVPVHKQAIAYTEGEAAQNLQPKRDQPYPKLLR